ncbi:DUF2460 domain-containing protein [Pelagerythrobacter marinus]|uniref:DUF2460 domain-containing protein n=1 Tax=Pelagerythrobacter marinus TaxID=538382 RepID=UPI0020370F85|nr:DUF2460 domain-containing protein [Pelagerythrobacter marinus]USA39025.1 DUF2460 domain-containing protein [Pelagerythrobacter marinus]WPZ06890.1 DUF2460 domain-containing protein [Pelagerythrobacter marinus]
MPYWLARERRGQEADWIQRFDPRFWTVDFPRPMMACVVATAPDALRVDCEFLHQGQLAGLIWASEDRLDHPLLAYETRRDYSHTVLRFRWRSGGIVALDRANGPTLTIEGRDAAGQARSWYVRLWNYASGSPTDARIELPFSALGSGWSLPGTPVHPADIDRMFISLVPEGYVPGSTAPLAARAEGFVEMSEIACHGDHASLAIGDVMLPPHGERIATAYDDAYNQEPTRLLRNIRGLGYRDRILHYLGMSHFPRLEAEGDAMPVARPAAICTPARRWHERFYTAAGAAGYAVINSLSYELLADHCPAEWQQRAHDGSAARTGWDPPSALLSPANGEAMAWLQSAAVQFTALQQAAGLPVLFQVGEPWWWVVPHSGAPCLYDDAAIAAFGGAPPAIADMRAPLDGAQTALLDDAGALLAQSTAALGQAVRDAAGGAAGGGAEILLLAFTPTILDPAMPELKRANLPAGWAWPAFDRLQLEDYDWLTAGFDARCRAAIAEVDARLGYPVERQDYLSGFVLDPADADAFWPRIDAALDRAAGRGVGERYVWALPQVARDGYTRLAPPKEDDDVQAFDDVEYPLALGRDAAASPEFATSVAVTASGHERRNTLWADARLRFDVGPGIRSEEELGTLIAFFRARRGAARGFRLRDPFDHSSSGMTGPPGPLDQLLGTGDGARDTFALVKAYGDGTEPQLRPITRPRAGTVRVSVDGAESFAWTLLPGGRVQFVEAPPPGAEIRAGFAFDVPVRFEQDRLDVAGANFAAGEAPSVPLIEIREAA